MSRIPHLKNLNIQLGSETAFKIIIACLILIIVMSLAYALILSNNIYDLKQTISRYQMEQEDLRQEVTKLGVNTRHFEGKARLTSENHEKSIKRILDSLDDIKESAASDQEEERVGDRLSFSFYRKELWQAQIARFIHVDIVDFEDKQTTPEKYSFGNTKFDRLEGYNGLNLYIDGLANPGYEFFNVQDGMHNIVTVLMPGFNQLGTDTLTILGDDDDQVVLDGCLKWSGKQHGLRGFKYVATDFSGEQRTLEIKNIRQIDIEPDCNQNYIERHKSANIVNKLAGRPEEGSTRATEQAVDYETDDETNIYFYKKWVNESTFEPFRDKMAFLIGLMEQKKLPTEFPRLQPNTDKIAIMQPLYFKPQNTPIYDAASDGGCPPNVDNAIITNKTGRKTLNCAWNNQIYLLSDRDETLDDAWGDDIIFPGKGEDTLDIGWGQDIVVLEKDWGHKIIGHTCNFSEVLSDKIYTDYLIRTSYKSLGFSYEHFGTYLRVSEVISDSSAQRAGIKPGDLIVGINGEKIAPEPYKTLNALRKGPSSTVKLNITEERRLYTKTLELVKEDLELSDTARRYNMHQFNNNTGKYQKINYDWPFSSVKLIVFGPGIKRSDMIWQGNRTLINQETGDKITFKDKPCFDYVYAEDDHDEPHKSSVPMTDDSLWIASLDYQPHYYLSKAGKVNYLTGGKMIRTYVVFQKYLADHLYGKILATRENFYQYWTDLFKKPLNGAKSLDQDFMYQQEQAGLQNAIRIQKSVFLGFDENLDGQITPAEIEKIYKKNIETSLEAYDQNLDDYKETFKKLDLNENKVLTADEYSVLDARSKKKLFQEIHQPFQLLWEWDFDGDHIVREREIFIPEIYLADRIDANRDQILSEEEIRKVNAELTVELQRDRERFLRQWDTNNHRILSLEEQVNLTVKQVKSIQAAFSTFHDMFDAVPGDMVNADQRFKECDANICASGDGNGKVGNSVMGNVSLFEDERHLFWVHLGKSKLLEDYSIDPDVVLNDPYKAYPNSPLGGVFQVYQYDGSLPMPETFPETQARTGTYLLLTDDASGRMTDDMSHFLTTEQVSLFDQLYDDGNPLTGSVLAAGNERCLDNKGKSLAYFNGIFRCLSMYVRLD